MGITKDADFYYSHLLPQRPHKLLLVRCGNLRTSELRRLFEKHPAEIVGALEVSSLLELDRSAVRIVASFSRLTPADTLHVGDPPASSTRNS